MVCVIYIALNIKSPGTATFFEVKEYAVRETIQTEVYMLW